MAVSDVARAQSACENTDAARAFNKEAGAHWADLVRINGPGTNQKLAQELMALKSADQDIRKKIFALPDAQKKNLNPEMNRLDAESTEKLKEIVARYGWPTIALVGIDASEAAILLLIHSPDHEFQRKMIPQLRQLVDEKKIIGSDVAILIDKELRSEGKTQLFGTQFSFSDGGRMKMDPVQDPAHLEERRRAYLLPPMEVYKCTLAEMYHHQVN